MPQGTSYVNVKVTDIAGLSTTTNGAYLVRYDTNAATVTGNPSTWTWRNTIPSLSGRTWTDSVSGLAASVQYSVGSTSGGTEILGWTILPTQPTSGLTTAWTPTWTPSALGQGVNYVNVRVTDRAGNQVTTPAAYTVQYDTTQVSSTGNPQSFTWRNTGATLNGVTFQDATSGLQATASYSVGTTSGGADFVPWTSMPVQPTAGTTAAWTPSWSPSLTQGTNYVSVRLTDVAGNTRTITDAYTIQFDTGLPTVTGNPMQPAWQKPSVAISGVTWQDILSGLATSAQYSVGTTSGATNVQGWTTLLSGNQPPAGSTNPWTPNFTPTSLVSGTNYVNMRVWDQAGNQLTTNGAWVLKIDGVLPTIAGNPSSTPWSSTPPNVRDVTWQDPLSGLAASVQYSIGTTSGGTNVKTWTTLTASLQPTAGQLTPWTPAWIPSTTLQQGLNYVNMRVSDTAGNLLTTNGAYVIRYDTSMDSITGLVAKSQSGGTVLPSTWQPDNTPFYEWNEPTSSAPISGYSYTLDGTDPDATQELVTTWIDAQLGDGVKVFKVRAKDAAGNLGPVASLTLRIDANAPILASLDSPTHPAAASFYNATNATVTWVYSDPASGVHGYYAALTDASCPASLTSGALLTPGNESLNFTGLGPFGVHRFCLQAQDEAGNVSPVSERTINVDAVAPVVAEFNPERGSHSTTSQDHVHVAYNDADGGADPTQLTRIDVTSVRLLVDDVDVLAAWAPLCAQLPVQLCSIDVTADHIDFAPLLPFSQGNHTLDLEFADTAIPANKASVHSYFIVDASDGATGDFDGDQVTDSQEYLICKAEDAGTELDGTCTLDGKDWLPPHLAGISRDADTAARIVQEVLFP